QAASNLLSVPSDWCKAAIDENQGNIDLVDHDLRKAAPAELKTQYDTAADLALPALRKFQDLLTNKLQYLDNYSWRLGPELYDRKFRLAFESSGSPQDVLAEAEKELLSIRARMYDLALPIYQKLPGARPDLDKLDLYNRQQVVIGAALAKIA